MTVNIRNLSFAAVLLITMSGVAFSQVGPPVKVLSVTVPGKPPPPPPPSESHNVFGEELKFGPIGGAKSKPQVQVLARCRVKYSKELEISTVWTKRFGRTGWWCTYKPKRN